MYTVSFYAPLGKSSPAREFLDSCQSNVRAKILRQLKYVEEYGLTQAIPNLKKMTSTSLWELRILGRDNVRIVCVPHLGKEVKVLHIFMKKKQKIPINDLNIALKRYKEVLDR